MMDKILPASRLAVTAVGVSLGVPRPWLHDDHGKGLRVIIRSSSGRLSRSSRISGLCVASPGPKHLGIASRMPLARTSSFVPSAAASSTSETTTTVAEHVVFFSLKEGTGEETKQRFIEQLTKFASLDGVIQTLSAESLKPSGDFSIGVYTRFTDKSFIGPYLDSPLHQDLLKNFVGPHVSNGVLLDYETNLRPPVDNDLGAIRIAALKFKPEASPEDRANALGALRSLESGFTGKVVQVTCGNNFSDPDKFGKGFDTAAVIRFKGPQELQAVVGDPKFKDLMNTKVERFLSTSIFLDLMK